jgi:hypothetical protein
MQMSGHEYQITDRTGCQGSFPPTPSYFAARLSCLLDQLRAVEREFFSADSCDVTGLAAAQAKLLWLRLQAGIPVRDGELREARLTLERFLEAGP